MARMWRAWSAKVEAEGFDLRGVSVTSNLSCEIPGCNPSQPFLSMKEPRSSSNPRRARNHGCSSNEPVISKFSVSHSTPSKNATRDEAASRIAGRPGSHSHTTPVALSTPKYQSESVYATITGSPASTCDMT